MARIIALAGSPREKNGHTWELLREFTKGVESRGGDVKVYNLNDPGFRGCQGCFYCRTHDGCGVEDYFSPFYDEIGDATGVVFASPIYFAQISGQAKMGIDRLFPMLDGKSFSPRYPGKRAVTLFSQGDSSAGRFLPAVEMVHGFLKVFGWKVEENILCSGVSAPGYKIPEQTLRQAYASGEMLAG